MDKIAFSVVDLDALISATSRNFAGNFRLGDLVNILVGYIFPAAGIALLIYLIMGGYQVMLSGGNPKNIEQGKAKITNAIVGFLLVFLAYWIARGVAYILGLRSISYDVLF